MKTLTKHIFYPLYNFKDGFPLGKDLRALKKMMEEPYDPKIHFERAKEIIQYAYKHSNFYRKFYEVHHFHPSQLKKLEDLNKVPILDKMHIMEYNELFLADGFEESELIPSATGGTTGNSFQFMNNKDNVTAKKALTILANQKYGWDIGDKAAFIWAASQDLHGFNGLKYQIRRYLSDRIYFFNATMINEDILDQWIAQIRKKRIEILYGYVNPIYQLARYLLVKRQNDLSIRLIVTTAEPLYDAQRKTIQEAFQKATVRSRYASREHGPMAQECEYGNMHYFTETILVESRKLPNSDFSELLVTDFYQKAFPFIRYRIGDLGKVEQISCPCGSDRPVIRNLTGRNTDFLFTINHNLVSGMALHGIFYNEVTESYGKDLYKQIQFVQDKFDEITINIVPGKLFNRKEQEKYLRNFVTKVFGAGMKTKFVYMDEIPRTKSGKFRFTVNHLITSEDL
jgi:phenylacetate-CoA ligase